MGVGAALLSTLGRAVRQLRPGPDRLPDAGHRAHPRQHRGLPAGRRVALGGVRPLGVRELLGGPQEGRRSLSNQGGLRRPISS